MSAVARKHAALQLLSAGQLVLAKAEFSCHPRIVRALLWEAQAGRCMHCDHLTMPTRISRKQLGEQATIDHIYPKAFSGRDGLGNLGLMHWRCNNRKGSRMPTKVEIERLQLVNAQLGWPTPRLK